MASPLLMYVLRTALPSLVRTIHENSRPKRQRLHPRSDYDTHTDINKTTNYLLEYVFLPLLRSLTPVCDIRFAALLEAKNAKIKDKGKGKQSGKTPSVAPPKLADTRTDILALLGASLAALDALPSYPGLCAESSIATGIRVRLGLETIRELEALYAGPSRPPAQPQPHSSQPATVTESEKRAKRLEKLAGTRQERIRALAVKDAAWYLASTLNLCVPQSAAGDNIAGAMGKESSDLLREALVDRVGKLVRSVIHVACDGVEERTTSDTAQSENGKANGYTVDPVCQSMLLAVCERALSGFAPA
ncbi:hypothetical protein PAXRUDRAFT_492273 [Paxillus rubicundulus Ve08.2h10]|uniref:Uncharacterized protein n=1 Tax=Paxillus rubicundulus Ve08.2h10 TaxID=930991 RepID=A0A0D0DPD2_9AGAM|nr:hypothetical protein PAXRUDRAFT_492273 [Paxillus rubicundulus Ve08.2h10]